MQHPQYASTVLGGGEAAVPGQQAWAYADGAPLVTVGLGREIHSGETDIGALVTQQRVAGRLPDPFMQESAGVPGQPRAQAQTVLGQRTGHDRHLGGRHRVGAAQPAARAEFEDGGFGKPGARLEIVDREPGSAAFTAAQDEQQRQEPC
ncbi:hypothetical protein ABT300_37765 [Streptomyces sp. NPDC001027]|uniref:hypothetical protein n=1 Tax=Streptomyces sp. NPDC001027 TaxID=3154771 RepID=UPI0033230B37